MRRKKLKVEYDFFFFKDPATPEISTLPLHDALPISVYANLRCDVIKGLGLTYATLGPINPAIVCVSLSAYGRDGDRSSEPGYDPLIQAEAGWAARSEEHTSELQSQSKTVCRLLLEKN